MRFTTPQLRFPARIQWLALLGLFVAGLAVVPFRVNAQDQPASTAAPAAAGQASQAEKFPVQPGHEKAEEEDEHTIYLHTPLVASIGKALHLSVDTTANLFLIINFAIIALGIGIPFAKFLPKVIRKRNITLSHSLETARKTTADAHARLSKVEAKLSKLDEEIAKIRTQVEEDIKRDEARIKTSLEEETARIVTAAEQEISVAAAQARRGLRHFAADLAIERAASQLVLTPETDRALIAEFVNMAQDGGATGGKN